MWPMIADPDLRCAECRHAIQPGRLCLSELPEETPSGVSRSDFNNYCIGCPGCWAQGKHACYLRHLDSNGKTANTRRSLPCARCGRRIGAGERATVELYYEWPEALEDSKSPINKWSAVGGVTAAASLDTWVRGVPDGTFDHLSQQLQQKFKDAGLSGEYGARTLAEAQSFYKDSIPYPVRNLGENAVRSFVDGKEASHIIPKADEPHLVLFPDSFVRI